MTTRTDWVGVDDLATALGISPAGAQKRAKRTGWTTREVPNPNGGRPALEYAVADLPEGARAELAKRRLAAAAEANPSALLARRAEADGRAREAEAGAAELGRMDDTLRAVVEARLWICEAAERFATDAGLGTTKARARFASLYEEMEVPAAVREAVSSLSARTLARWQKDLAGGGPAALAPAYGKRSARAYEAAITEDNELGALVLGYLLEKGRHATAYHLRERALAMLRAGELTQTERVPTVRTFDRYLAWLRRERPQTILPLVEPHAHRGKLMPAFGSASDHVVRVNQEWELDSTLADIELADVDPATGETTVRRFALVACVDVFSRRARVLVTRSSRSVAIASVLRRCLLEWGVPELCHLDNGKDYTSAHVTTILRQLTVERRLCRPFAPWEKPHVERFIGTLQRHGLVPLPGYTGADVAARQELRARREKTASGAPPMHLGVVHLTPEELQEHLDDWIATVYSHRPHRGLDGAVPFERAMESPAPARRIQTERALDVLLARPAGSRQGRFSVGKNGVQYQPPMFKNSGREFYFYDRALTGGHMGTTVVCREDPGDVGKLWAFTQAGEYIGVLVCPQLVGMSAAEAHQRVKAAKAGYAEHQRIVIQEARRATDRAAALDVVAAHHGARTGANRVVGQITPSVAHETPALRESARAAVPPQRGAGDLTPEEIAASAEIADQAARTRAREQADAEAAAWAAAQPAAKPTPEPTPAPIHALRPRRLYADDAERYVELADRLGRGEALSDDERAWFAAYESRGSAAG